jgi:hypothetical protein
MHRKSKLNQFANEEFMSGQPISIKEAMFPSSQNSRATTYTSLINAVNATSTSLQRSIRFIKESLERSNSDSKNPLIEPVPISIVEYMKAVGHDWPSKNEPYYPPPGSVVADGVDQYYRVFEDGYAYPIDADGKVFSKFEKESQDQSTANPVVVKIQNYSYPELQNTESTAFDFNSLGRINE